eukprot:CAMPEP_0181327764 /NCGR_PEP_ID=MMETSP1101-20121128/22294_1 /TAXON_ID=46948 /ORGANISM="Rhodomonas abbreviata, Strain Caron Lab Isolate" /LENGTH=104 /DNA_ID=CAMNT_0023436483 /DNA_START=399 /DNA_END=710 /DNA_ORIENTATION=-
MPTQLRRVGPGCLDLGQKPAASRLREDGDGRAALAPAHVIIPGARCVEFVGEGVEGVGHRVEAMDGVGAPDGGTRHGGEVDVEDLHLELHGRRWGLSIRHHHSP